MWPMRSSTEWRCCAVEPRERLKRYLEQRRELGERELVLDGMTVEDVMKIVGAVGSAPRADAGDAPSAQPRQLRARADAEPRRDDAPAPSAGDGADWRGALRASGVDPAALTERSRTSPPLADRPPSRKAESTAGASATPTMAPLPGSAAAPVSKRYEFPRADDAAAASPTAPVSSPGVVPTAGAGATPGAPPTAPNAPAGIIVGVASRELFGPADAKPSSLEAIAETTRACTRCRLYATATKAVPGEGNADAELVCVGEAPGASEDASGLPFVGQAGQLLTKILAAINLRREDVFICNVLKHRPPGNRNPLPDEVAACSPYLVQQLEVIRPKVIVAFGTFAAQTLLATKLPIGKLRGSVHRYYGIPLIVTYHPAALLRNPAWKRPTWEDVQLARRILDSAPRT